MDILAKVAATAFICLVFAVVTKKTANEFIWDSEMIEVVMAVFAAIGFAVTVIFSVAWIWSR